jgi:hypothetical protein
VFWVNWEPLNEFKFVIETLAALADDINEPLTTPISVNLVSADWVNKFWFASATDAADAELINEPLTTPI